MQRKKKIMGAKLWLSLSKKKKWYIIISQTKDQFQMVVNLSAIQETQVQSLGQEDPLEKRMATHSSIPAWRISWTETPGGLQSMGWQRVGHGWAADPLADNVICSSDNVVFLFLCPWQRCCSVTQWVQVFVIPGAAACQASLSFTISRSLLKLMSIGPLSWWCHPSISSCVIPFSCPQSSPASGSFQMSQFFSSGGQIIAASASASVLLMRSQGWFPLGFTGLISLQSKELSRVFSNTTVQKHQLFNVQPSLWSSSHIHTWLLEKP